MGIPDADFITKDLYYTVVDMSLDNGLGAVVSKNNLVHKDTFSAAMLTAVRHGNGRDWWLVTPERNTGRYVFFLLDHKGVSGPFFQKIGASNDSFAFGVQAVFAPSGKRYANFISYPGRLQIHDFDRCAGRFTTAALITFPDEEVFACGVAFSPDSRYLYATTGNNLYQFDMLAPDIDSSRMLVGVYDGATPDGLRTNFYMMRLAPDGKIYMSSANGSRFLHVINEPNKRGTDCNFVQRQITLPTFNSFTLPNFPYFNLFDAEGAPCDTLHITVPPPYEAVLPPPPSCAASVMLLPNPTSGQTTVLLPKCSEGTATLYNLAGQWLREVRLIGGEEGTALDMGGYPPGIYFLNIRGSDLGTQTIRVSVVR